MLRLLLTLLLAGLKFYRSFLPRELAAIPGFLSLAIVVANILIIVTFSRMKAIKLQHYFMCVLAVVDLMTLSAVLPSTIGIWQGCMWLSDDHCKLTAILGHVFVATTDWLHPEICVERSYSILNPLNHRTQLTKFKPKCLAVKLSVAMMLFVMTSVLVLTNLGCLDSDI